MATVPSDIPKRENKRRCHSVASDSVARIFASGLRRRNFSESLSALKRQVEAFIAFFPAVVMLTACIPAALSFHPGFGMAGMYACIGILCAIVFCAAPARRVLQTVLIPAFLVTLSAQFAAARTGGNELAALSCHDTFAAVAKLEITDSFASEQTSKEFQLREMKCCVLAIRDSEGGQEIPLKRPARCLLRIPDDTPMRPAYGDVIEAEGVFRPPTESAMPFSFNYGEYLALQEIHEIFYPDRMTLLQRGHGFFRGLFRIRDGFLARVTSGIRDPEVRAVAMAMLFGGKSAIPRTAKELFLHSGAIHLLTVSGTHVMIVAGLLLLLFAAFPTSVRYSAAVCLVFLYVLMTGLQGSAIRAFTMLGIVFLTHAFSMSIHPMNSLSVAAAILLFCDPASVMKTGMHYSFLSVALLILYGRFLRKNHLRTADCYDRLLAPRVLPVSRIRMLPGQIAARAKQAFQTCFLVSGGTSALTLLYQGFLPVQGIIANFLIIPAASFLFIFSALSYIFHAVPLAGTCLSFCLSATVKLILAAEQICLTVFPTDGLAKPPVWSVLLFLTGCFFLLTAANRKILLPTLSVMAGLVVFWHVRAVSQPDEIAVFYGGRNAGEHVTAVFTSRKTASADIINLQNDSAAYAVADYLESRGIRTCRFFVASSGRQASFAGVRKLEELSVPVLTVAVPASVLHQFDDSQAHAVAYDRKNNLPAPSDGTFSRKKLSNDSDSLEFDFGGVHGNLSSSEISVYDNSGRKLLRKTIPYSSKYSVFIQEISL